MTNENKQTWTSNLLILLSILGRIIPHPQNFTPVGAVSLIGGAKLSRLWRWTIPFIALALSDILVDLFYDRAAWGYITPYVYGAFAINIFLGRFIRGNKRYFKLGGLALLGSIQFFFITNFGTWMEGLLYPKTWEGLTQCFVLAIPYFQNTLLGDLCWSFGLFAVIERSQVWLSKRAPQSATI